jgi:small subunit ribosomal protein S21
MGRRTELKKKGMHDSRKTQESPLIAFQAFPTSRVRPRCPRVKNRAFLPTRHFLLCVSVPLWFNLEYEITSKSPFPPRAAHDILFLLVPDQRLGIILSRFFGIALPERKEGRMSLRMRVHDKEPIGLALRRFKKLIERSGMQKELRARQHYEKPSELRRRARLRREKAARKAYEKTSGFAPPSGPGGF